MKPATRSALILVAFASGGVGLACFWVYREAERVVRQQQMRRALTSPLGSEMVWIPAGKFTMGSNGGRPDEKPIHDAKLRGFWMDRCEVTNEQFARFVEATGYVTTAEQEGAKGASVFAVPQPGGAGDASGWQTVPGACWKHPEGPGSDWKGREKMPVVLVSWHDAAAYAKWAGKRLPTEAEWEYAARGGLEQNPYPWGREPFPKQLWMMNIWQGNFPLEDKGLDGFKGASPVSSYSANAFGLFDVAGNVWEWVEDWYRADAYQSARRNFPLSPESGNDPEEPAVPKRVLRGGSFLTPDPDGRSFRISMRGKAAPEAARSDVGFRCVKDAPAP